MESILKIDSLSVEFKAKRGFLTGKNRTLKAVSDASFSVYSGETLGLVGESGCGKSTLGKAIIQLLRPSHGTITFLNQPLQNLAGEELRNLRRSMQIIFQDPLSSLNPRMRIGKILEEPLIIHKIAEKSKRRELVFEMLKKVGLREDSYHRFPHEFSGGQRQRIGIARALMVKPKLIVADEPVSALDVSIQAQILNLLSDLQKEFQLTYLFISHDLHVIRYLCDRIVVMYLGEIMEILTRDQLIDPNFKKHPYTQALIDSSPRRHPLEKRLANPLKLEIPSPIDRPSGCVFHTRCQDVQESCRHQKPQGIERSGRFVSCHFR